MLYKDIIPFVSCNQSTLYKCHSGLLEIENILDQSAVYVNATLLAKLTTLMRHCELCKSCRTKSDRNSAHLTGHLLSLSCTHTMLLS